MTVPRIDTLTAPPVVGKMYVVPTVRGSWRGNVRAWPVCGPRHNDSTCLKFPRFHYHIDWRFVTAHEPTDHFFIATLSAPLMCDKDGYQPNLPAPVWLKRMCRRNRNPAASEALRKVMTLSTFTCLRDEYAKRQAPRDERGWVCPHRMVPLADRPVVNGVITCPLHFLQIDAVTGLVLDPPTTESQGRLILHSTKGAR